MRSIYLTLFLLQILSPARAQTMKGRLALNFGYQSTYNYKGLYSSLVCDEGCYPTVQRGIPMPVLNILYDRTIRDSRWTMVLGVDVNSKGWEETGMVNNGGGVWYEFKEIVESTFMGVLGGLSYDLVLMGKYKIVLGQLLNPEVNIYADGSVYRSRVLGTRTTVSVQGQIGKNRASFLVTPYFHTALMKYNEPDDFGESTDYTPYGFGLTVGVALKAKDKAL